jgi:hypothetical protein
MKKLIQLIFLIALILNFKCSRNNNSRHNQSTSYKSKYPWVQSENSIPKLVTQLEISDCVYGKFSGIAGEENIVYDCFDRLYKIASDTLWVKLAHSKSAVTRVYAYKALLLKNSNFAVDVKKNLKSDTTTVCWRTNDTYLTASVGFLISNF